MRAALAPLAGCLALAGCVTAGTSEAPREPAQVDAHPARCSAAPARGFIGRQATQDTGAAIHRATGASVFQWVPPDTAVTMDYRPDRVRVTYDRAMTITGIACG